MTGVPNTDQLSLRKLLVLTDTFITQLEGDNNSNGDKEQEEGGDNDDEKYF